MEESYILEAGFFRDRDGARVTSLWVSASPGSSGTRSLGSARLHESRGTVSTGMCGEVPMWECDNRNEDGCILISVWMLCFMCEAALDQH